MGFRVCSLSFSRDFVEAPKEIGYYTVSGDLGVGQCGVVRKGFF